MCSITLPKDSLRNLDQPQCHALPYIVSHGSTLEWCVPCAPSCLKFYLSYKLFPSLNSCFTILFSYFGLLLCFLSVTNRLHSHFSLHYFTIKPLVHRRIKKRRIPYLHNFTFKLHLTIISLSRPSTALSIIVSLHAALPKDALLCTHLPKLCPTSPCATMSRPPSPYVVSSQIQLGILYIHIISYISLFLIGC